MQNRLYIFTSWLLPTLVILLISGCIPIPIPHPTLAETESIDYPEHHFTHIVVSPSAYPEEIKDFTNSISGADKHIEIVSASKIFSHAFPNHAPAIEVKVGDLLDPVVRGRIRSTGVRFIVVVSPYLTKRTTSHESGGPLAGVAIGETSTRLYTGLIDLDLPASSLEYFESKAHSKGAALWLAIYIVFNLPMTEDSTMADMAHKVIAEIRQISIKQPVKIMVIGGDWESGALLYKKEQDLSALQERARLGDSEAQWKLSQEDPIEQNLVWLCRAADQGHISARKELGRLYLYGSKNKSLSISQDISRACMWLHLSQQVNVTEAQNDNYRATEIVHYESAEIERITKVMTTDQVDEAEKLVEAWKPGQCASDLSRQMIINYADDLALARLCIAADEGDYSSRDELGRIYFFGSRGVPENLAYAYMWYRLAEDVYVPPSGLSMQNVCDAMTPSQRNIAIKLIAEWKPGLCEKQLLNQ